ITPLLSSVLFFCLFLAMTPPSISTLSLHDALPISGRCCSPTSGCPARSPSTSAGPSAATRRRRASHWKSTSSRTSPSRSSTSSRSEEHTSELQSLAYLVCRLLLEKKNDRLDRPADD